MVITSQRIWKKENQLIILKLKLEIKFVMLRLWIMQVHILKNYKINGFPIITKNLGYNGLTMSRNACEYDLDHIPFFMKRELYFQAFDILCKAFQEYLQTLFIANKIYPIAYNKWIKEQIVKWLNKPDLYPKLPPILSVSDIESNEIIEKANMLRRLLNDITK